MIMASVGVFHPAPAVRILKPCMPTIRCLWPISPDGNRADKHHQILLDVASATKQADFAQDVAKLPALKAEIEKAVTHYKSTNLRVSRTGGMNRQT